MRLVRIAAVAATSVALALPVSAAQASLAGTSADSATAAALPQRVIKSKIVNVNPQHLQIRTKVRNYPSAPTFLQKKDCRSCNWHQVDRKQTSRFGRVAYPVGAPSSGKWFYRVGTPKRAHFAVSYGQTFYTYQR